MFSKLESALLSLSTMLFKILGFLHTVDYKESLV